ncbi:uncharacterized protein LOC123538250 [Mercenaria mercenaria]|uniref:uncharacterized protein LOC123538250 n=1 Tax=Mercenaria mercenaria TaxID=6596 RepID=UPI00234E46FA|nr:uncharacterized protein LOC123538250 [Mercenaria mercenaria]
MAEKTVSTEHKTELDYQLDFLNDDYFYIPFGQNDVTVWQLLTVDTQQLYDAKNDTSNQVENKENTPAEVCNSRFQKPRSTVGIKNKQRNAVPAITTRSNIWAINVWKEWAESRNLQPETASEPGFPIPLDIGNGVWLQRFICEIKRKNGEPYPPATLQNIAAGIQRYLPEAVENGMVISTTRHMKMSGYRVLFVSFNVALMSEGFVSSKDHRTLQRATSRLKLSRSPLKS